MSKKKKRKSKGVSKVKVCISIDKQIYSDALKYTDNFSRFVNQAILVSICNHYGLIRYKTV